MNKLTIAAKQLAKGNIGNAIAAIATKSASTQLIQPARYRNGNFFFGSFGADKAFIWGNYNSSLRAYQRCPVVSSIINRQALATINGKVTIIDDAGKESQKVQAKTLRKLLKRPNPLQSGKQFRAQNNVYKRIYGYCPVLRMVPVGFENDFSAWRLWNIPPWMIQVEDNTDLFFLAASNPFKSIRLTYMGRSVPLDPANVFFLCETQISTGLFESNSSQDNVSLNLPDSKLLPVDKNINNIITSLDGRGAMNRERGPMWILSNDTADSPDAGSFPLDTKAKDDLQKDFLQYGITGAQKRAIITDAKLKLQTVGFDVGQLKLLEGEIQDAKFIADNLNYPPYLLGLVDAKFDNQQIAERNMYTNSIIPDAESDDEQWSDFFKLDDFGLTIKTDYSHLPALQEDDAKASTSRLVLTQALKIEYESGLITKNQWLQELGLDPMGPEGDVRSTDASSSNVPLASIIGVGGVQSVINVLTAAGLSEEARANVLQIVFGINQADAASMVVNSGEQTQTTNDQNSNNNVNGN
jgi:hypothetical protein